MLIAFCCIVIGAALMYGVAVWVRNILPEDALWRDQAGEDDD